jgi:hypothetical protein
MKPRTPAQIEAARRNGAKSRGPITAEGKLRSGRNAGAHGLLARTIVLAGESNAGFQTLLAGLEAEHQPRTPTEMGLVETMAVNRWRQLRIWGLEKAGLTRELAKQTESSDDNPTCTVLALHAMNQDNRAHDVLLRYDTRFTRAQDRAVRTLNKLRADRRALGELPFPPVTLEEK